VVINICSSPDDDVFRQEVHAFSRDQYAPGDARPKPSFLFPAELGWRLQGKQDSYALRDRRDCDT
jgi:hypothetical protein